ncbi:hypothetical protein LIER_36851 [Lithospermum erythrorhizon]|uniref:Uncharacterized protein n=1 Tax=Lithospermum erythrorhizon TaxID=34254 RepID=A0AAV3PC82_LITER
MWRSGYQCALEMRRNGELGRRASVEARNALIFEGRRETWEQIWKAGVHLAEDYNEANSRLETLVAARVDHKDINTHKWRKSEAGYLKFNVDAAFNEVTKSGAAGVLRRAEHGDF